LHSSGLFLNFNEKRKIKEKMEFIKFVRGANLKSG